MEIHSPRKSNIGYSVDWRLLIPLTSASRLLVICDEPEKMAHAIELAGTPGVISYCTPSQTIENQPLESIAIPYGAIKQHFDFYQNLHRLLLPDGMLLVGFDNQWCPPAKMKALLRRAGFSSFEFLGVIPDLNAPEYTFPLTHTFLNFIIRRRYGRKIPVSLTPIFFQPLFLSVISNLLPSYFVIATF